MTDQEILKGAPKGATHFIKQTLSVVYFKFDTHFIPLHWCNNKKGWRASQFFEFNNFRLLSDVSKIAELEKDRDIRDLEQQIGAISDYSESLLNNLNTYSVDDVNAFEESYINALRKQAKALRGQGE